MTLFFESLATHTRIQLSRHLRSPAIWILALAAPIAARFMLPEQGGDYSIMSINSAYLALDPATIGLQLGVIMAVILTPLAYIFLRAGPTRRQPWQADDLTPARRTAQMLGHWIADTVSLWVLMLVLGLAGVVISLFRLPLSDVRPIVTLLCLCLIAAPALAVIAGLRTIFSTRRGLRGAGGDVLFFFVWLALLLLSSAFFATRSAPPILDVFGFAAPLAGTTTERIESLVIFGPASSGDVLSLDAWSGVMSGDYLFSRLFWLVSVGVLVALFAQIYAPHKFKALRPEIVTTGPPSFSKEPVPLASANGSLISLFLSEIQLVLRPRIMIPVLLIVAAAGVVLPFRGMVGPALALLLTFPFSQQAARWRGMEMSKLSALTPLGSSAVFVRLVAMVVLSTALCLPSLVNITASGATDQMLDIVAIGLGLPLLLTALGYLTRSAVTGRLIALILWYGYLNI